MTSSPLSNVFLMITRYSRFVNPNTETALTVAVRHLYKWVDNDIKNGYNGNRKGVADKDGQPLSSDLR